MSDYFDTDPSGRFKPANQLSDEARDLIFDAHWGRGIGGRTMGSINQPKAKKVLATTGVSRPKPGHEVYLGWALSKTQHKVAFYMVNYGGILELRDYHK